jgi:hypothetical protein
MKDSSITAPVHPPLGEITDILADKGFPVFLTKYGPAIWPVTNPDVGPPVIVLSVPRSGTYFTEALYTRMGYNAVYVHAMDDFCNDTRFKPWGMRVKLKLKVGGIFDIPITLISRLVLPGQIVLSHCGRNLEIETALSCFKKIYLYRELREVIVSHSRAHNKHNMAVKKPQISTMEFCSLEGANLRNVIKAVSQWRNSSNVLAIDFADLTCVDPLRQQRLATRFGDFMGWPKASVLAALEAVPGDPTPTKSAGGHSVIEGAWDHNCEAWFRQHLGDVEVCPGMGSTPPQPTAE